MKNPSVEAPMEAPVEAPVEEPTPVIEHTSSQASTVCDDDNEVEENDVVDELDNDTNEYEKNDEDRYTR